MVGFQHRLFPFQPHINVLRRYRFKVGGDTQPVSWCILVAAVWPYGIIINPLSKGTSDLVALTLSFYPIFHIAAIAADITNNRDFFHQCKSGGINIVTACMAVLVVGNANNIL